MIACVCDGESNLKLKKIYLNDEINNDFSGSLGSYICDHLIVSILAMALES